MGEGGADPGIVAVAESVDQDTVLIRLPKGGGTMDQSSRAQDGSVQQSPGFQLTRAQDWISQPELRMDQ